MRQSCPETKPIISHIRHTGDTLSLR